MANTGRRLVASETAPSCSNIAARRRAAGPIDNYRPHPTASAAPRGPYVSTRCCCCCCCLIVAMLEHLVVVSWRRFVSNQSAFSGATAEPIKKPPASTGRNRKVLEQSQCQIYSRCMFRRFQFRVSARVD